jgi:hypothetical protein
MHQQKDSHARENAQWPGGVQEFKPAQNARGKRTSGTVKTMTHNPADPRDPRHAIHAAKPIWETFDIAVEGTRPVEHAHRIERYLAGARGLKKVAAHLTQERVTITYDARLTNPAAIHDILIQRGYKASAKADY